HALPRLCCPVRRSSDIVEAPAGPPASEASHAMTPKMLTEDGSAFTSSLYRDVTAGLPSETEHILGDLSLKATELAVATPLLDLKIGRGQVWTPVTIRCR